MGPFLCLDPGQGVVEAVNEVRVSPCMKCTARPITGLRRTTGGDGTSRRLMMKPLHNLLAELWQNFGRHF